jgi:hypothetical protein
MQNKAKVNMGKIGKIKPVLSKVEGAKGAK